MTRPTDPTLSLTEDAGVLAPLAPPTGEIEKADPASLAPIDAMPDPFALSQVIATLDDMADDTGLDTDPAPTRPMLSVPDGAFDREAPLFGGDATDDAPILEQNEIWWRRIFNAPEPAPMPEPIVAPTPEPAPSADLTYTADDFTGAGQAIVIIDDGWSAAYDQSNLVYDQDFFAFGDPSAQTTGTNSHGSWVAQTAVGVADGVDIIHLKVFSDTGGGASFLDIDQALDWVVANGEAYNVAAVNLSLGGGNATDESWSMLSDEFAILDQMGIFSVVAAGNSGQQYAEGVNVIAADPNVIGVSATTQSGALAGFSQKDPELTDIAAVGVDVPVETTWGAEFAVDGTSFAAPYISGIAALLQEASQTVNGEALTDEEFLEILQASGTDIAGYENSGYDGFVEADADAALEYFLANSAAYDDPDLLIA
ncbi:MAG: S8 family serine peptidase [Paracoccaceae bacterium]